jgi:sec-independent protein translocase protein TatA
MNGLLFMRTPGIWEILIILFIVLLLFGGRKIPELMKGLGKGIRNFKEGINNPDEDEKESAKKE